MSNYFNAYEQYGEKYYQVPKVLFTSPIYAKSLNDRQKIAYGMLKDRLALSIKNGWYDSDGNVYFVFSNKELENILCCSNKTVVEIKKALISAKLLEVKKIGRGYADHLYLKRPIVTKDDIYLIDKSENVGAVETCKSYTSENDAQTVGGVEKCKSYTSGSVEVTPLEVKNLHPNNTDIIYTENKETEFSVLCSQNDGNYYYNLKLPMKIKKFLYENREKGTEINFNPSDLEIFYNSSLDIQTDAEKDDIRYLNEYDILHMVKTIYKKTKDRINNTHGLLVKMTQLRMSYKTDNVFADMKSKEY